MPGTAFHPEPAPWEPKGQFRTVSFIWCAWLQLAALLHPPHRPEQAEQAEAEQSSGREGGKSQNSFRSAHRGALGTERPTPSETVTATASKSVEMLTRDIYELLYASKDLFASKRTPNGVWLVRKGKWVLDPA